MIKNGPKEQERILKTSNSTQRRPVIPTFLHVALWRLRHCFVLTEIKCFPITVKEGQPLMLKHSFSGFVFLWISSGQIIGDLMLR
jgi:hypothetical protein